MGNEFLIISYLESSFSRFISSLGIRNMSLIEITINKELLLKCIQFLFFDMFLKFQLLLDIWIVDYPQENKRFQVNYLLVSLFSPARLRLISYTSEVSHISSLTLIFKSANWLERECYDCFGVFFSNHPDLRRILTDYGFEGYPLRKDFPLSGYFEVRYDDELKKVIQEPLRLSQEFRYFDFLTPWENVHGYTY